MVVKKVWTLILLLCIHVFFVEAQNQNQRNIRFDISSPTAIVTQSMTYFFTLEKMAKPYCQKYSNIMPIWCSKCKTRKFHLGEFSGCILALLIKNVADQKEVERLAAIFENFLKILTMPEPQEAAMVDFVVKEMKNIAYQCTECHSNEWEKISK